MFQNIKNIKKGLKYASIFTSIYFVIGSIGILLINMIFEDAIERYMTATNWDVWLFLIITSIVMFYIAFRFIYKSREDVAELMENQEKMNMYKKIFDHMHEGLIITDKDANILNVNPSFETTTKFTKEEALGKNPNILNSGMHSRDFYRKIWGTVHKEGHWQGEIINKRKNGELYPEILSITAIKNKNGDITNYIGLFRDISSVIKSKEKIEFLTHYDSLTRLPLYPLFMKRLTFMLQEKTPFVLLVIELRKLKALNATYGYRTGDEIIQKTAIRLQNLYKGMSLSRVNSKDFAFAITNVESAEHALETAKIVLYEIEKPIAIDNEEYYISANIGISLHPFHGSTVQEIYQNADAAKAHAKENNLPYHLYNDTVKETMARKISLEKDLMKALELNQFTLYFQPQINIKENRVDGFETLLRWEHPDYGPISPDQFIPIAEENGQIIPISEWIIEYVCKLQQTWQELGFPPIKTAINISPKHFQSPKLIERTAQILKETKIDPFRLEFEITESLSIISTDQIIHIFHELKHLGIALSVDDFGTGYSNLSYLQKLPIHFLKIDRSFIKDIPENKGNMSITRAIIAMAHELNLSVIAEGVETEEQLNFLKESNCDVAQGYYYSKPIPAQEVQDYIASFAKTIHS